MSVVRTKVLGLVDVIMRVPSLFIIDEILKISMGLPNSSTTTGPSAAMNPAVSSATVESVSEPESLVNATLNATMNAAAAAAADFLGTAAGISSDESLRDDIEFYKFISLTTLKFVLCLFGK